MSMGQLAVNFTPPYSTKAKRVICDDKREAFLLVEWLRKCGAVAAPVAIREEIEPIPMQPQE